MQARKLSASAGKGWLMEGVSLYRRNPGLLTSAGMAYLVVVLAIAFLPFVGTFLIMLLQPMLSLLLANVCAVIDSGRQPTQPALMRGMNHRPQLLRLGALQLGIGTCMLLLALLLENLLGAPEKLSDITPENLYTVVIPVLLMMLPVFMSSWFAPLLTGWHQTEPMKAVFFSIVAVWRNFAAFFVYGLYMMLAAVVLPGMVMYLCMLVFPGVGDILVAIIRFVLLMTLVPILLAGSYVSYRGVFAPEVEEVA